MMNRSGDIAVGYRVTVPSPNGIMEHFTSEFDAERCYTKLVKGKRKVTLDAFFEGDDEYGEWVEVKSK